MPGPTVTLDLPPEIYDELQQRADHHQRPLEEEVGLALTAAVTRSSESTNDLEPALVALTNLDDDVLWQVSHSQPTVEDGILFHALIDTRKRRRLTAAEHQLLTDLGERHDRVMILRAKAVALLHERGVDVSERVARASITRIGRRLRAQVMIDAGGHCGYCRLSEEITGIPLEIEHILPEALGGLTHRANLWAVCRYCNLLKSDRVAAPDPETDAPASLFNPREHRWAEHFLTQV